MKNSMGAYLGWFLTTVAEAIGIFMAMRFLADGGGWNAFGCLLAGELVEVGLLTYVIVTSPISKPRENNWIPGAVFGVSLIALGEALLWLAWWALLQQIGVWNASLLLFVGMHLKHTFEIWFITGQEFAYKLWQPSDAIATLFEVLGAVVCYFCLLNGLNVEAVLWLFVFLGAEHYLQFVSSGIMESIFGRFLYRILVRYPKILAFLGSFGWISRLISRRYIHGLAGSANPRPHPFSMASSYSSWNSLTDRSYTGRHLPEADCSELPPLKDVVDLWRRGASEVPSTETSMLFSLFAQWFTDGFLRTDMKDRNRNTSNHEIDLCQVYGLKECKTNMLRSGLHGKLKFQMIAGEMYPPYLFDVDATSNENWVFAKYTEYPKDAKEKEKEVEEGKGKKEKSFEELHELDALKAIYQGTPEDRMKKMFAVGVEHGNSTIGHTIFNTIFLREHNRICDCLSKEFSNWGDERLFQTARNILIVMLLRIVIRDYIKHISPITFAADIIPGDAEKRSWYRTNRMSIEFNLLYRWHSMVPEAFAVGTDSYSLFDFRNNVPLVVRHGLGELVNAASMQRAGKIGLGNTHQFFFMPLPFYGSTQSVMEITVQMARDAQLRPYNEYREAFGLRPLKGFGELTDDPALQSRLSDLYQGKIENVEWLVGIFAQKHEEGAMLGDLMTRMVGYDAFTQALTNPLLSKNLYNAETFTKLGLREIDATNSLHDIFERNLSSFDDVHVSFNTSFSSV